MEDETELETIPSAPPPSYEDVVAAGSSVVVTPSSTPAPQPTLPSFPPTRQTVSPARSVTRPTVSQSTTEQRRVPQQQRRVSQQQHSQQYSRTSHQRLRPSPVRNQPEQLHFLEKLARFNMAGIMLNGVTLPSLDVQLDSEAHLSNRRSTQKMVARQKQIKCICSCLWCYGFTLLFFLVALPVAMLLTGIFAFGNCPYRGHIIVISLIMISVTYFTTLIIRLFNSCLSCCKLGNMLNSEKSLYCSACIGIMEGCFVVFMIVTTITVLLGTWFLLEATPSNDTTEETYCSSGVYYAAVIMLFLTYLLSISLFIYLVIATTSYYLYKKELESNTKKPQRRPQQRNEQIIYY